MWDAWKTVEHRYCPIAQHYGYTMLAQTAAELLSAVCRSWPIPSLVLGHLMVLAFRHQGQFAATARGICMNLAGDTHAPSVY